MNGINFSLGLDTTQLASAFDKFLRFAGDFVNQIKRTMSLRGLFDGLAGSFASALGGTDFSTLFSKAFQAAAGKEQIQQNFEGILGGNADIATGLLAHLGKYANDAGFANDELQQATRTLIMRGAQGAGDSMFAIKMLAEIARGAKQPINELADAYADMTREGHSTARGMMHLEQSGVPIYQTLRMQMGLSREAVKKLGDDGKISLKQMEQAFVSLTSKRGIYFNQVERHRNTLLGLWDDAKDALGKVPTAFLSGVIDASFSDAKESVRWINEKIEGWGEAAKGFGQQVAAALQVARQLYADNKLGETVAAGLKAAFLGAIDFLAKPMASVAAGFGAAISGALQRSVEALKFSLDPKGWVVGQSKLPEGYHVIRSNRPISNAEALSDPHRYLRDEKGRAYAGGSMLSDFQLAYGNGQKNFDPHLRDADLGKFMGNVSLPFLKALSGFHQQAKDSLALASGTMARDFKETPWASPVHRIETDALGKIGLHVGGGGPQGEQYAKDTARHTATSAGELKKANASLEKIVTGKARLRY